MLRPKSFEPKTFHHKLVDFPGFPRKDVEGVRHYVTPEGTFPSVTTLLGIIENPALERWRDAIGHEAADEHAKLMAQRGTNFHNMIEKYTKNDMKSLVGLMPDMQLMFRKVKPWIDRLDNFRHIETALYDPVLGLAGTPDCVAEFDGALVQPDYKTCKDDLKSDVKAKYALQITSYGRMWNYWNPTEKVTKGIIIAASVDVETQIIVFDIRDWEPQLIDLAKKYKEGCRKLTLGLDFPN